MLQVIYGKSKNQQVRFSSNKQSLAKGVKTRDPIKSVANLNKLIHVGRSYQVMK